MHFHNIKQYNFTQTTQLFALPRAHHPPAHTNHSQMFMLHVNLVDICMQIYAPSRNHRIPPQGNAVPLFTSVQINRSTKILLLQALYVTRGDNISTTIGCKFYHVALLSTPTETISVLIMVPAAEGFRAELACATAAANTKIQLL